MVAYFNDDPTGMKADCKNPLLSMTVTKSQLTEARDSQIRNL
jgi:hypothetical protein